MAEQDDYVRITLRIPRRLHANLARGAKEQAHSINAEIIKRLRGPDILSPKDARAELTEEPKLKALEPTFSPSFIIQLDAGYSPTQVERFQERWAAAGKEGKPFIVGPGTKVFALNSDGKWALLDSSAVLPSAPTGCAPRPTEASIEKAYEQAISRMLGKSGTPASKKPRRATGAGKRT
jgi:hypothetical protein